MHKFSGNFQTILKSSNTSQFFGALWLATSDDNDDKVAKDYWGINYTNELTLSSDWLMAVPAKKAGEPRGTPRQKARSSADQKGVTRGVQ